MRLLKLQELFWATATRQGDTPAAGLRGAFVTTPALDAESRMDIYSNMYVWRHIDVLREDFPKLAALVGDEAFYELSEAYVRSHPSMHHSLSKLGQHFETFLKSKSGFRPDLSNLAALEWARAEVFEEADLPTASPQQLAQMAGEEDFALASLTVVPALRSLRLEYDVLGLWRELEEGHVASPPKHVRTFAVVWRKKFEVFHVQVPAAEARALVLAAAGEPMANVCEAFEDSGPAVEAAFKAIGSWFSEGWIAAANKEGHHDVAQPNP